MAGWGDILLYCPVLTSEKEKGGKERGRERKGEREEEGKRKRRGGKEGKGERERYNIITKQKANPS